MVLPALRETDAVSLLLLFHGTVAAAATPPASQSIMGRLATWCAPPASSGAIREPRTERPLNLK